VAWRDGEREWGHVCDSCAGEWQAKLFGVACSWNSDRLTIESHNRGPA